MNKMHQFLDKLTDEVVPALDTVATMGIEVTTEDREALSDWLQDRFRNRAEDVVNGPAT